MYSRSVTGLFARADHGQNTAVGTVTVETWLGRIGLLWLVASLLAMMVMSAFVFVGTWRRRLAGLGFGYVTFEPTGRVIDLTTRAFSEQEELLGADLSLTRSVSERSGAIDRLLAGVSLPCGLTEVAGQSVQNIGRVAFQTTGFNAREVAVAVVHELQRMGVHVESLSQNEARAFRDGIEVSVTMFVDPNRVVRDRRLAFPSLDSASVVIEFAVV